MKIKWQFEFPPEIQAEREPILAALDRAMQEATAEACLEAQMLAGEWLARHPEDLITDVTQTLRLRGVAVVPRCDFHQDAIFIW